MKWSFGWIHNGTLLGFGEKARIHVGSGPDRWRRAAMDLQQVFEEANTRAIAFGSFTFDERDPDSSLVVAEDAAYAGSPDLDRLVPASSNDDRIRYAGSTISEVKWLEAVDEVVARIAHREVEKVVLARDLHVWSKYELDPQSLAVKLAKRFPECYAFVHGALVGATPELLVSRQGAGVESRVLAGTARRGSNAVEDDVIGKELMESVKDGEEHRLAVESATEVFRSICSDYVVQEQPSLLKLDNVQHLATSITGALDQPLTALEIAGLLHPTAAVCGTPTTSAMTVIRELEGMERGRYSGPVGWVDSDGDGEFGIALRCAEIDGNRARLFAGNGIVAGSRPEAELEETRLKLRAMQSVLEEQVSRPEESPLQH
jgi:menaquinone-specific isochorismate synthase